MSNQKMMGNSIKHADGMSSDDEMSSLDQATLGKVRQDVENQARTGKNPIFFISVSSNRCAKCQRRQFSFYDYLTPVTLLLIQR